MSEAPLTLPTVAGWFGKLPSLGDFASRRLPFAFVQRWDRWLQRCMVCARDQLGERWNDTYLVAPILRFWIAPNVFGDDGWTGLMMPSVDRVGRQFPLTVALPKASLAHALAAHEGFAALDRTMRQVLAVVFSVSKFEAALATLAEAPAPTFDDLAQALAARLQQPDATAAMTLWWCGDASEAAEFRRFSGLPPAADFAALIGSVT